ncbi:hypothetical protein BEN60_gp061 [Gordonia phage Smoothie]|uniref:dATP/dGTP diphosphohydrolase N-terminal domain-containing protein n=1 Tax=Gordonia phage Smoothie TaxID=1838078 RepID=A0A160DEP0_9CAUD|nr:hypothetical protein BEN60_gp061 [Gordonia phage Smoothie]ANA86302.1 hypothetical protein PBI_SMOOTHIE_146 [Gordonia phage Smoothie]
MSTIETNDKGQDFAVSTTGGKKQKKLARYDLIPAGPLLELAELYGRGAAKYADRNWENGYDWSLSFSALQRHAWQFWDGENFDEETGAAHLASVAWHALALLQFMQQQKYTQFDDRPQTESIVKADVHEDHVHVDPDPVATSPEPELATSGVAWDPRGRAVAPEVQTLGAANFHFIWRDSKGVEYTYQFSPVWAWSRSDDGLVPDHASRMVGDFDAKRGPYVRVRPKGTDE